MHSLIEVLYCPNPNTSIFLLRNIVSVLANSCEAITLKTKLF